MATSETNTGMTATQLLRQQHEQVKTMFSELVPASGTNRAELFDCLRATLAVHETAEEMIVHPAVRSTGERGQKITEARLAEESEAKQVLADLEKMGPDSDEFPTLLEQFRQAVLDHAQAEETEAFPLIEAEVPVDKQREMADAILTAEKMAPTHPHPHGPESAAGNFLVGPFVAMIDKVRDKLSESRKSSAA